MKNKKFLLLIGACIVIFTAGIFFIINNKTNSIEKPGNEKEEREAGGVKEAMNEWFDQRAYPGKVISLEYLSRAFETSQNQLSHLKTAANTQWEAIGPKNFGGRTLFLAFNPQNNNTLYAGSASGGLWRSYTAGVGANAWHYVPTGFPVLGVSAIAISPVDSNIIYIGTGEVYNYQNTGTGISVRTTRGTYGIGILKSVDNGITWTKSLDWSYDELKGVQDVVINSQNANTIWAATTEGTYVTYDAGNNWILKHNIIMANDIEINSADTSMIFVSCGNFVTPGHGIYKSTNAGNTFTKLTAGLPTVFSGKTLIDIHPLYPHILFASVADSLSGIGLYSSNNYGNNWTLKSTTDFPKHQGWYSHDVKINPADTNTIIAAGIDAWKSTNNGFNLTQKSIWYLWDFSATPIGGPEGPPDYVHGDIHQVIYQPGTNNVVYYATDGGIFRSVDNGETFAGCNGMYQTQQFYANFSNSTTDSLFAIGGMQDNATAVYEGNLSWRRVIGGDGLSTAIDPFDDYTVYASYQYLNVLRSDDKAQFFQTLPIPSGNANNTNFAGPYELCENMPNILYSGRTFVYKSTSYGNSWTSTGSLDGNPVNTIAISPNNCDIVYVGTTPRYNPPTKIFKTTNGGANWTNVTGNLPDRYPMDIAINPVDNNIVYVVYSGFGTPHVYKTINGGTTWTALSGLPDVPTNTIVIDPLNPDYIYVGNDLGVYFSPDAGQSWINYNDGLDDATLIMHLSISHSNRKLRLATHGKGIWEREMIDQLGVDVEELNIISDLNIYPNPATDKIYVNYKLNKSAQVNFILTDIKGKILKTQKLNNLTLKNTIKMDINNFSSGTYLLIMETNGKKIVKKVVKQ